MKAKYKYVIIGAGVSGLSTAYGLSKANNGDLLILEKDDQVGGLCKTISRNKASYDLGSHRIHSQVPDHINQFISQISVSGIIKNTRAGKLRLNKSYITYPINSFQFFISLGLIEFVLCSVSFLKYRLKRLFNDLNHKNFNYESYLIDHAGKRAYKIFYEPYARKVWGCEPRNISVNAAKKRVSMSNPLQFIKEIIIHYFKKNNTNYYYYLQHGIGDFPKGLEQELEKKNVEIVTHVIDFDLVGDKQSHQICFSTSLGNIHTVEYETLISTIPVDELVIKLSPGKEIAETVKKIKWRGMKLVFIHVNEEPKYKGESFYFPEIKYIFGRVSLPKRFSGSTQANNPYTAYVCEVPCSVGDEIWNMKPVEIYEKCFNDLVKARLVSGKNELVSGINFFIELPNVYPLYTVGWQINLEKIIDFLGLNYKDIYTSGKCGFFLHCNLDHSIGIGLQLAQYITEGKQPPEWYKKLNDFHNLKLRD